VRVEIIEFEDALAENERHFRPSLPFLLSSATATINAGASLAFNLFQVTVTPGFMSPETGLKVIPGRYGPVIIKDDTKIEGGAKQFPYKRFTANFTKEATKDLSMFYWKWPYRIKIVVTARDFPKNELEFDLTFYDCGTFCRFTLIKTD